MRFAGNPMVDSLSFLADRGRKVDLRGVRGALEILAERRLVEDDTRVTGNLTTHNERARARLGRRRALLDTDMYRVTDNGHSAETTRIAYVVGARPNFVKMAPVIAELRRRMPDGRHALIHTGQHYDRLMSDIFLEQLGVPAPDHMLGVGSASHAVQTARVMERIEPVLEEERPDLVIVPGDVNSTLAATLVAVKLGIPVAHLESGLRSFDRTMPEEINRIIADEFSEYLFLHCDEAIANLQAEGIGEERIHFVGNTMIDSLVAMEERFRNANTAATLGLTPGEYLLVTLHRPALVDGPLLADVIARLDDVSRALPVLFPVHPRTRKMMERMGLDPAPAVLLTEPVSYLEFLSLEADARAVLTDSGGVQEETTYLGVPCFTLRDSTERPVTVRAGTNTLLGLAPERIDDILPELAHPKTIAETPLLWDGRAAARVAEIVLDLHPTGTTMRPTNDGPASQDADTRALDAHSIPQIEATS
jgi:UDP-N-acetylglucosamine 2-epimerase (non-hydrolysing)